MARMRISNENDCANENPDFKPIHISDRPAQFAVFSGSLLSSDMFFSTQWLMIMCVDSKALISYPRYAFTFWAWLK